MADRSVSIRLGTTGKADVTRAFDEIASSGDVSAKRWSSAFKRAGDDVEAAMVRQERAARNLEKLMPGLTPGKLDMYAGNRDSVGKSAEASAAVFTAAYDQMERRAAAFAAALDPAIAAQQRFDREIAEARNLISAGAISLDQYCAKLAKEQGLLDVASAAQGRAAVSAGAHRAAMQGLSFQAQDAFTQLAMGANPLTVIAIQGAQAAGQMANMGGKMGAVAGVLAGPWGLAVSGGLMLLGALTDNLLDSADAADTKKAAAKSLTDSIDELNQATGRQIKSEQQVQAETLRSAAAMRQQALDARTATIEKLRLTRADVASSLARTEDPTLAGEGGFNGGAVALSASATRLQVLNRLLKQQEKDLVAAQVTFRQAEAPAMQRRVAESFDASAAAAGRYERGVDRLNQRYAAGKISQAAYAAELSRLTSTRDRDVTAARNSERATRGVGAEHRASDGAARGHAAATREAAAAQRELDGDLAEVVRRFDPARAAAEGYAQTLAKVTALTRGGKLTAGEAFEYRFGAVEEENRRRAEARAKALGAAAKDVFGAQGDPLADVLGGFAEDQRGRAQVREQIAQEQQQREEGVRKLAGLYEGLFSGGSKSIWKEFEGMGRQVLSQLLAKWTMSAIGGGSGGGVGGFLSSVASLFGRGSGGGITGANVPVASSSSLPLLTAPKLASGTEYWSGGMALLGEGGVEAAFLPRGTRVSSSAETRRMLAPSNDNGGGTFHFDLRGAVVTQDLLEQMESMANGAAVRGAAGGAAISQGEAHAAGMRRLGRRWG